jgi:RNA polymerase sigma factor (sigma-70 family)
MSDALPTRTTTVLLEALKDERNADAWRQLDARYRPIVVGFVRGLGLSEFDAAEIAQQTLAEFARAYAAGGYSRDRGRLSSWVIGIAHHLACDFLRARARGPDRGQSALTDIPDTERLSMIWERERKATVLSRAMAELRKTRANARTIRAFELVGIRGVPAEAAARECGMTVQDVYTAKNRITSSLRKLVQAIEAEYAEDD